MYVVDDEGRNPIHFGSNVIGQGELCPPPCEKDATICVAQLLDPLLFTL